MKKSLTILLTALTLVSACSHNSGATQNKSGSNDTSAYQTQRHKINKLLDNRSVNFGQYDNSLTTRTGIFGFKTKKDMQRSINILMEIVRIDNHIFKELKILLDYKDLEKTTVKAKAENNEGRIEGYIQTIGKLQQQNKQSRMEIQDMEKRKTAIELVMYATVLICLILSFFLLKSKKQLKIDVHA